MSKKITAIVFLTFLLTACGGGGSSTGSGGGTTGVGGSGSSGGTTNTSWEPAVASVPAATYTGDNLTIYTGINSQRSGVGAGLLKQNTALDQAAAAHAQYILQNWSVSTLENFHTETSGLSGFTGVTVGNRISAAGYTGFSTGEIGDGILAGGTAADCLNGWIDTVYHSQTLLNTSTDVGIAAASDSAGNYVCVVDFGTELTGGTYIGQLPATTVTFPYSGDTNVQTTFVPAVEAPNPAPDLGTIGQPILVWGTDAVLATALPNGWQTAQVTINAFTVTAQGSNTPIATRIVVPAGTVGAAGVVVTNDVAGDFTGLAYALPLTPLSANTTYHAVFSATVAGQPVNVNWSFTTGASSGF